MSTPDFKSVYRLYLHIYAKQRSSERANIDYYGNDETTYGQKEMAAIALAVHHAASQSPPLSEKFLARDVGLLLDA